MAESHRISFEPVNIEMEVGEDENDPRRRVPAGHPPDARMPRGSLLGLQVVSCSTATSRWRTTRRSRCNDAEVEEGYVLLCRSHAFSDCTIELLNFDEDELLGGVPDPGCPRTR